MDKLKSPLYMYYNRTEIISKLIKYISNYFIYPMINKINMLIDNNLINEIMLRNIMIHETYLELRQKNKKADQVTEYLSFKFCLSFDYIKHIACNFSNYIKTVQYVENQIPYLLSDEEWRYLTALNLIDYKKVHSLNIAYEVVCQKDILKNDKYELRNKILIVSIRRSIKIKSITYHYNLWIEKINKLKSEGMWR